MPAYYTPKQLLQRIDLYYQRGDREGKLRIQAREVDTRYPVTSAMLINFTTSSGSTIAYGYQWYTHNDIDYYQKNTALGGSYMTSYYNRGLDEEETANLAAFNQMIMEMEEATTADQPNVLAIGSDPDTQWFDGSIPEADRTWNDGQLFQFYGDDDAAGSCKISLFTKTEYTPDPVSRPMSGGLTTIKPQNDNFTLLGDAAPYSSYTFNTDDPPRMSFWIVNLLCNDVARDGSHYGETVPCLLIVLYRGSGSSPWCSTLVSLNAFHAVEVTDDPTTDDPAGTVTPGGWVGLWDYTSDSDSPQAVSGFDFVNRWAHGIRLYYITDQEASAFMTALWSMNLSQAIDLAIDSALFRQNVDFVRGVVCLHKLPCSVGTSGTAPLSIMGYDLSAKFSGLSALRKVSDTYGSVTRITSDPVPIPATFGDTVFMDWNHCKAVIRLPFVGQVPIDIKAVRGGSIFVSYAIDILTGNCVAQVFGTSSVGAQPTILLYQGSGNCALSIPFSGNTEGAFKQLGAVAGLAGGIAAAVASGNAALAVGAAASLSYGRNTASYEYIQSETAAITDLTCKLIVTGDIPVIPPDQRAIEGYQAGATALVRSFAGSGYLSGKLHADIYGATAAEKQRIEDYFAGGVII